MIKKKVYLDTIGCRLNQSEIERFAGQFVSVGYTLTPDQNNADLAVINTCTVTAAAAADSRKKIRQTSRAGAEVVVTGCWSTLEPEAATQLPGVITVIENSAKDKLVQAVTGEEAIETTVRQCIPGKRQRTRAFIKVQDGCNNKCTFCITTVARGSGLSHPVPQVIEDIEAAIRSGVQEAVLTGVHLGSWGTDLMPQQHLCDLVQSILDNTSIRRLRLSSIEPWNVTEDLVDLYVDTRLAPHFHLPLQSGSDRILRLMARKITTQKYADIIKMVRMHNPRVAITTDIITGFPGETDEDFADTLAFVERMNFAGGHVFTFSEREGTAAATMPDVVPHKIRKERSAKLRQMLSESAAQYRKQFIGKKLNVLFESASSHEGGWLMNGLSGNYIRVQVIAEQNMQNQILPARIQSEKNGSLVGMIVRN